jgi:histidine ammonia-lyase
MGRNAAAIVAIELLAAAQGVDFRRPLKTSPALARAHAMLRDRVPFLDRDRPPAPDIAAILVLIAAGRLRDFVPPGLLPSAPV